MTKTLAEIMAKFTPEEQTEIEAQAQELIEQEMTLRELRKAYQLSQTELSQKLNIEEDQISQIEKQTDLLLSTFTSHLQALGGNLKLVVEMPKSQSIVINQLAELKQNFPTSSQG